MQPWSKDEVLRYWAGLRDATLNVASRIEDLQGFVASDFPEESCRLAAFLAADNTASVVALSKPYTSRDTRKEFALDGDWRGQRKTKAILRLYTTAAQSELASIPGLLEKILIRKFGPLDSMRQSSSYSAVMEQAVEWLDLLQALGLPPHIPPSIRRDIDAIAPAPR